MAYNSGTDLGSLKILCVPGKPPRPPRILRGSLPPLPFGWLKANTKGSSLCIAGRACYVIFRISRVFVKGCFSDPTQNAYAFEAEIWEYFSY